MSDRSREELLEMIQQIGRTRNPERKNKLIDRFNGEEGKETPSVSELSK
jgi:hypothetical protein